MNVTQGKTFRKRIANLGNTLGPWLIVALIAIILSVVADSFLTTDNVINVLRQISVNAIVALGVTFVVLGGEIDLSMGMNATFTGCVAALMLTKLGMSIWLTILICLAIGTLVGCFTGFIVTILKIPAFIGSLGVQYMLQGITLLLTNSMPISNLPAKFLVLGRGYIAQIIPVPTIIMAVFVVVGAFLLKYIPFGRNVLSVGENATAARLSGINVIFTKIVIFAICGFCSAAAGIVQASRLSSGQPASNADLSLQALAAVFVGGTFKGSMMNTLAGTLALGLVNNGLNQMGVNPYWQKLALGIIIILAVLLDQYRIQKSTARK